MNLNDDGWCYGFQSPSRSYCLPKSFKLRTASKDYLFFQKDEDGYPKVLVSFDGREDAYQQSVVQRVLPGLVPIKEYCEGEARILIFAPGEPQERGENLYQAYIEFAIGSVVTIQSEDSEALEEVVDDMLKGSKPLQP